MFNLSEENSQKIHATTILAVLKNDNGKKKLVICSDGQVSLGHTVFKSNANKVRKIEKYNVLMGFAGSGADGMALFERLEAQLEAHSGQLMRACVELSKHWRADKALRKLEAMMIVGNLDEIYIISGMGDVMSPEHNVAAIGSGGNYALSAALALSRSCVGMKAEEIARNAMQIAGEICIYTNTNLTIEVLEN